MDIDQHKAQLIKQLDDSRASTVEALNDVDPQQVVYTEAGWRVKDIIAHLTAWEAEVVLSIQAYNRGGEYAIPGYVSDDAYNEVMFRRYQNDSTTQIWADWEFARSKFKAAIQALPPERFDGQIMCPWKKTSGIDGIVRDMINHEAEHLHDIINR
jgi:hypothetical protein